MNRYRIAGGIMLAVILSGCTATHRLTDASPRHRSTRVLQSGELVVEVMEPNAPDRYNRGVRFTPIAAVLSVRVGGREYLFNPIEHDPVDDHAGLAAEFDLVTPDSPDEWLPPGYAEAKAGEGFLKIGVGVLAKQPKRYSLFQRPAVIALAPTVVTWHVDRAVFSQRCAGVNGYAYELSATVTCDDAMLIVDWTLINAGTKPFTTRQYSHNFFRINARDVGPGYVLQFPYAPRVSGLAPEQTLVGNAVHFERRIPQWVNLEIVPPARYDGPNMLSLMLADEGDSVRCTTSLPNFRTAVHARAGYVSPEQFVELHLTPGQSVHWRRTYHFESGLVDR